jgi:hypothetical protein
MMPAPFRMQAPLRGDETKPSEEISEIEAMRRGWRN